MSLYYLDGEYLHDYQETNYYSIFLFLDKYTSQFGGMVNQYAYYHEEDDTTFQLVDTARVQKPIYQRGRIKFNQVCLRSFY